MGHPEFQAMAKQPKENVKQSWKNQVRNEDSKQTHHKMGQSKNSPSLISGNGTTTSIRLLGEHGDCPYDTAPKKSKCPPTPMS